MDIYYQSLWSKKKSNDIDFYQSLFIKYPTYQEDVFKKLHENNKNLIEMLEERKIINNPSPRKDNRI